MAHARIAALLLGAALACASGPKPPELERFEWAVTPGAAEYPDVPALVLLDRGVLELTVEATTKNPIGRLRRYRRFKILRPDGLPLARLELPVDPGSLVSGLVVRSTSPAGVERLADPEKIFETPHPSGRRAKALVVEGAEVGTIIDLAWDVLISDLRFVPPWVFQLELPVARSEFAVVAPPGFAVDLRYSRDGAFLDRPPERFDTDEGTRYSWVESDLPARFNEPGMPSAALLSPRAHFIYLGAKVAGRDYAGFATWDDVGAWFVSRVPEWAKLSPETVAEAKRIAGETSLEEQALKLTAVLARDLAWEPGPRVPLYLSRIIHPELVLKEKRGNATSRGLLLVSLLRAVGIPALPALAAYRDRGALLPDLPTAVELDLVAAVVPRPQGLLLLDPSQPTTSVDVPSPRLQGTRLVVLREDGAEVMLAPTSSARDSKTVVAYDLKVDQRGDLFGGLEARLSGAEAGALRELLFAADPAQYAEIVTGFLRDRGAALPLESASIADLSELRRPLSLKGSIQVRRAFTGEGTEVSLPLARLFGQTARESARLREVRRTPLKVGAPRISEVTATISLPEDWELGELMPAVAEAWSGGKLELTQRGESRRRAGFARTEVQNVLDVSPETYPDYRRYREALRAAEEQRFLVKRPAPRTLEY